METPGESLEYRTARNQLLEKEIELRRAMEEVAIARRSLPPGGLVPEDYVFEGVDEEGRTGPVKLSELFQPGKDSLVIYNFMFPRHPSDDRPGPSEGSLAQLPLDQGPCPSCVATLDQLDGAIEHVEQNLNFAVIAKAPIERVMAVARDRGWRNMRLLSTAGNSFKHDYVAETPEGFQMPMLTVFHRDSDGIRHFWSSEILYAAPEPGQDPRHIGTLEPLWNLFDFTREGRPMAWNEQMKYGHCCSRGSRKWEVASRK
ncbi:MAG TPA: DUF899 family protein [Acidobacteriaceae bacterium]|jgi:predicted dithiol-disulfide oxidoreductase (DUF899 family)